MNKQQNTQQPVAVPDGYMLVPKEPTQAMISKAQHYANRKGHGWQKVKSEEIYKIMLSAAQKPEGGE